MRDRQEIDKPMSEDALGLKDRFDDAWDGWNEIDLDLGEKGDFMTSFRLWASATPSMPSSVQSLVCVSRGFGYAIAHHQLGCASPELSVCGAVARLIWRTCLTACRLSRSKSLPASRAPTRMNSFGPGASLS